MSKNDSSKILLVHGFASNYSGCDPYRKFNGFQDSIDAGSADLFRWGIFADIPSWNILGFLRLYRQEQKLSHKAQTQAALVKKIQDFKPQVIVLHSLGTQLFLNTVQNFGSGFLDGVDDVIIVQGDCDWRDIVLPKLDHTVRLQFVFCPWDFSLWESWILNLRIPVGLFGYNRPYILFGIGDIVGKLILRNKLSPQNNSTIKNKFWGFWSWSHIRASKFNFHLTAIGSKEFASRIEKI